MNGSSSPSLVVPLTFPDLPNLRDAQPEPSHPARNVTEISCSSANASVLTSWGFSEAHPDNTGGTGVVLGCQDGTLYIFHSSPLPKTDLPHVYLLEPDNLSRPISPLRHSRGSRNTSRTASASSFNSPPFNITARSRIVSGITTEAVEAPKNYVDFDDEPEKLKDMLKGRSSNLKHETDRGLNQSPLSPQLPSADSAHPPPRHKESAKSLLSATNSPNMTPQSISLPTSPALPPANTEPSAKLTLICHIAPPNIGAGKSVKGLKTIDDKLVAVLQEQGDLSIYNLKDGTACMATLEIGKPDTISDANTAPDTWIWTRLETFLYGESTMLLAYSAIDVDSSSSLAMGMQDDNETLKRCRLVFFKLQSSSANDPREVTVDKVGELAFQGFAEAASLRQTEDGMLAFYYLSTQGDLIKRVIDILPPFITQSTEEMPEQQPTNSLPLPNPFKALMSRSVEQLPVNITKVENRVSVGDELHIGAVFSTEAGSSLRLHAVSGLLRGLAWTRKNITVFDLEGSSLRILFSVPLSGIHDGTWLDDNSYALSFANRAECHILTSVDASNNSMPSEAASSPSSPFTIQPKMLRSTDLKNDQAIHFTSTSEVLSTVIDSKGRRQIALSTLVDEASKSSRHGSHTLWRASESKNGSIDKQVTSMLPLELNLIVLGYGDGYLGLSSIQKMCSPASGGPALTKQSDRALGGFIASLHLIRNNRTQEKFIVGGADDGSIAFWALDTLKLRAQWIIFTTPLENVIELRDEKVGPLHGCVLCISRDGTIVVIAVDGFQFMYLIPGSAASLQRICLGGNNMLLIYSDQRARLWDVQTKELWRSMSLAKAEELLGQGEWIDLSVNPRDTYKEIILSPISGIYDAPDCASTLCLDLQKFTIGATTMAKSISTGREQASAIQSTLEQLRGVLSILLTPGLNEGIDNICQDKLAISPSAVSVGFSRNGSISLSNCSRPQDPWCISPDVSASRAVAIVTVLRVMSLFEDLAEDANTVIAFYATSLAAIVGSSYQHPSLTFLARLWFDVSNELRQGIKIILDAAVVRLPDEDTSVLVERWQHLLPSLQPAADRESRSSALALSLCGYIAAEKYSLLSTSALTDISKSITMYLHDDQSAHRVLAIDLCSRGFHIWQHYADAMGILRALFTLATNPRKDLISAQNVGPQARLAVLQIASSNTPLFMTTLALDILEPSSVEHRKSVMQIFAFLIRKRPLVLYPNLPRLMEAVVKSLDPNSNASRDAVLDTATEILGHVIKTFPTVDFHMQTQRLAVGTSEGAIVMYDLKTATRLYVLEGHRQRIAACSFSPDGRRLVTVSLAESVVLVWKVGSSFASFFNPGAPPRQGHGGSLPFKTISFNVGNEADMTIAGTLEWVRFEWPADRSVKLKIRDSILTFST